MVRIVFLFNIKKNFAYFKKLLKQMGSLFRSFQVSQDPLRRRTRHVRRGYCMFYIFFSHFKSAQLKNFLKSFRIKEYITPYDLALASKSFECQSFAMSLKPILIINELTEDKSTLLNLNQSRALPNGNYCI